MTEQEMMAKTLEVQAIWDALTPENQRALLQYLQHIGKIAHYNVYD